MWEMLLLGCPPPIGLCVNVVEKKRPSNCIFRMPEPCDDQVHLVSSSFRGTMQTPAIMFHHLRLPSDSAASSSHYQGDLRPSWLNTQSRCCVLLLIASWSPALLGCDYNWQGFSHILDFLGFNFAFFFIDCNRFSALAPGSECDLEEPVDTAVAFGKTVDFELPPQFDVDFEVGFMLPDGRSAPRAFAKWKSSETANFGPALLCFEFLLDLSLECDGDEDGACFGDEECGFCEMILGAFCNLELFPVCKLFPLSAAQPASEPPATPLPEVVGIVVWNWISCITWSCVARGRQAGPKATCVQPSVIDYEGRRYFLQACTQEKFALFLPFWRRKFKGCPKEQFFGGTVNS